MSHLFRDPEGKMKSVLELQNKPVVGDGGCVDLGKRYADGLNISTVHWRAGRKLTELASIPPGTAIGTFIDGHFPQNRSGQHFAFFIRASEIMKGRMTEIVIMDQFVNYGKAPRSRIMSRKIRIKTVKEKTGEGRINLSNDLDYFYVIE